MGWFRWWNTRQDRQRPSRRSFGEDQIDRIQALESRVVLGSLLPLPTNASVAAEIPHLSSEAGSADSQAGPPVVRTPLQTVRSGKLPTGQLQLEPDYSPRDDSIPMVTTEVERIANVRARLSLWGDPADVSPLARSLAERISAFTRSDTLSESASAPIHRSSVVLDGAPSITSAPTLGERPTATLSEGIERQLFDAQPGVLANRLPASSTVLQQRAWFDELEQPIQVRYDFRALNGVDNVITQQQQAIVTEVLAAWSSATGGKVDWVRDSHATSDEIVIIGVGEMSAVDLHSGRQGTLGVGGGKLVDGDVPHVVGTVWLDAAEHWENSIENGDVDGTIDFATVMAHEIGHVLGLKDQVSRDGQGIMDPGYSVERRLGDISQAVESGNVVSRNEFGGIDSYSLHNMMFGFPQLSQAEVGTLLDRASAASASEDAIIAITDRNGVILGVRAEQDVLDTFTDPAELAFAIDGAVSKARTAAFFANDTAPLTSRLVRFISQSTVTQREVESNPNITDEASTERGPGFVAPIGLGGHFPPDISFTPPVDLFAIEHTNRDSLTTPGADRIMGTADDELIPYRFNIDPANVPAGQEIVPPISYGEDAGITGVFQNRGIATLPGGIPIYRDTDLDGVGDTLIGGIGVFFPGEDGYATFEQGFVGGVGQTSLERTNADKVLEAEFIALAALGGSNLAAKEIRAADVGDIAGIPPVEGIDLPFGCLSLVGINLQVIGPQAGIEGVVQLLEFARDNLNTGTTSGANQVLGGGVFLRDGASVAEGSLMTSQSSTTDDLTAADVEQIFDAAIEAANEVRAAVRLDADGSPGARTRMVFAITDTTGEVLGLYRMEDATVFSIDVAVAKARNVAYYADAAALQAADQIDGVDPGAAFTNRTFRFVAEPRFPDGIDGTAPPAFSIVQDFADAGIDPATGENIGGPAAASVFDSVLGHDAFHPNTNFQDADDLTNQNGIVFFPGSTPLYKDGVLVGGFGVSGDGVDQDDVVTFLAAQGFLPDGVSVGRADQEFVDGVRLPFMKFLRNPFG